MSSHYQTAFKYVGVDYFHASGHVDADAAGIGFATNLLSGLGVTIAIISDGVYNAHPHITAPVDSPEDFGVPLDFATEASRGTAIAGIICGNHISPSAGMAPLVASIHDIPLFRPSVYDAMGGSANHDLTMENILGTLATELQSVTADIIVIDINYDIFSITAGVDQATLDALAASLAGHELVCLSTGDVDINDDDFAFDPFLRPYQLLDSRIPSIRDTVLMISANGPVTQPLINTTKEYSDLAGGGGATTGHGELRLKKNGFIGISLLDKYEPDGTINIGGGAGCHFAAAFFAGFLALIKGTGFYSSAQAKRVARAAITYFPTYSGLEGLDYSSGNVSVYTGNGAELYKEKQIYINGWSYRGGFGLPNFEILARIVSNSIAGCGLSSSITAAVPLAQEELPAAFQSSEVLGPKNAFFVMNTTTYDGWPDVGPGGAVPFQPPADPAFFDRDCPF